MKTAAVICEYNPFHNGHAYQIHYAKERLGTDFVVAIMSGNFVQRGEPAILDKYLRSRMALNSGADLVLEIPAVFSTASAREYASYGVDTALKSGICDMLIFGTEGGVSLDELKESARICYNAMENEPSFNASVRKGLTNGMTYPEAVSKALGISGGSLFMPNNILAAEYLSAAKRLEEKTGRCIEPYAIERIGAGYNDDFSSDGYASASHIRKLLQNSNNPGYSPAAADRISSAALNSDMVKTKCCNKSGLRKSLSGLIPEKALIMLCDAVKEGSAVYPDDFSDILNLRLLEASRSGTDLSVYSDVSREMAGRLIKSADRIMSFTQRAEYLKTRQYTLGRVKRALMHIVLGITGEELSRRKLNGFASYIRILGFSGEALKGGLLKKLKDNAAVPVITKAADYKELADPDVFRDQLYYSVKNAAGEYERSPVTV